MLMLRDLSEIKCQLAEMYYNELLEKTYGIQNCEFEGYDNDLDLIFQIDLIEAKNNCQKKHCC
jgi:hypothetical protein